MSRRFLVLRGSEGALPPLPADWKSQKLADLRVITSPETPVVTFRDELLVIGDLFDREARPIRPLPAGIALSIIASDGSWLADHGWGRFAAIWKDRRGQGVWIYRDPSGHVPVHLYNSGALLAFSDLDDAHHLLSRPLSVDLAGLAHRLVYAQLQTRRTALEQVEELMPGECAKFDQSERRLLWSPWRFVPQGGDRAAAAEPDPTALRATITATVSALTADKSRALLELSGGLDSSILAASLSSEGARWLPITVVTPGPEGDERDWAAPVCETVQAHLHTAFVDVDAADVFAPPARLTPSPGGFGMLRATDRTVASAARALGADALISGTGGDNVFCSLRSPAPIIDAWRISGAARALRAARDLGQITQARSWEIAKQTYAYLKLEQSRRYRWRSSHDLLSPDCWPDFEGHPWLDGPAKRLAGSRAQVVMLLRAHSVIAAHDRMRSEDMIFPLLSQPILEACLSIASPHWIAGGQDRSVAREAFRADLPRLTIERRSKGRRDGLVARIFDRHRGEIGERLRDGQLAAAGLIDRDAIVAAAKRPAAPDDRYMRMLELLDCELWLNSMRDAAKRHGCGRGRVKRGHDRRSSRTG